MIASLLAAAILPASAYAQSFTESVVRQLRQQGFGNITVSNTLLGRTRIVASSANGSREIIIDPRTGEILRDLWQGGDGSAGIVDDRSGSGRDRGRDDDDDDDDDDDHSGSGSGGGGGGNSGSGGGGDDDDDDDDGDDD